MDSFFYVNPNIFPIFPFSPANSNIGTKQDVMEQPLYLKNKEISDWNDVILAGWYSGRNAANAPTTGWVSAINIPYNGDGNYSCLIATNGMSLYTRFRDGYSNVWASWREFATK